MSLDGRGARSTKASPPDGTYPYAVRGVRLFGDGAVLLLEHVTTGTLHVKNFDDVQLQPEAP